MIEENIVIYGRGKAREIPHEKTYNVQLNFDESDKHIGIGMSGGMDSAMLLWLLAYHIDKNNWDTTIHQWSVCLDERPFQVHHAKKVIQFVKDYFPNVKFGEHRTSVANSVQYIDHGTEVSWQLATDKKITKLFNGVTLNPSDIESLYWGVAWEKRATNRDHDSTGWDEEKIKRIHLPLMENGLIDKMKIGTDWDDSKVETHAFHENLPFIHDDKRVVLALYKKYGLLLELGPLTRSCEGPWERTDGFKIECKRCWWCIEKQWATAHIWNNDPRVALKYYPGVIEPGQ
jgi:hypothetical protein